MDKTHYISPERLTFWRIEQILDRQYKLALSDEAVRRIEACRQYLDRKVENTKEPIYGVSTGFGALCDVTISPEQLSQLQENLVISHACGMGNELHPRIVRLMLLLKAQSLAYGHSGVQVQTVQRILDFFNHDIIPVVFELGSLGASGDLAPLAHLFLPLLGRGEVNYQGRRWSGADILNQFGWQPIVLQSKEGLALLNGTQFMSAHGVNVLLKAFKLERLADIIAAVSLEAFDGRIDPFMDEIQQIRPHNGQIETADNFRRILRGSQLQERYKRHVQDPYSFRCIPQVHGSSKDAINHVAKVVETEINSVTDNPTIFPEQDLIVSGGNFHGQPLALAYDYLAMALAELGSISERRVYRLISGWRNLPEFLVAEPGLNSGFMIPQYAAAAIVSQNKQLATPASVDSIPSSNEQEDHVSMGGNAATKLVRIVDNLERILAIELFNAAQALDFRRPMRSSDFIEAFVAEFRKTVPFIEQDGVMYELMNHAVRFLQEVDLNGFEIK